MQIKNYEVLINEKQGQCGLVIDTKEYDLSFLKDIPLFYKVNTEDKKIEILDEHNEILLTFEKINNELRYYAFKTVELVIIIGNTKPSLHVEFVLHAQII